MRCHIGAGIVVLLIAASGAATHAQQTSTDTARGPLVRAHIAAQVALLRLEGMNGPVPSADSFTIGDRLIPAGTTVRGPVGVSDGRLEVSGAVEGNAIALGGDILVHRGGVVRGDALSVGGKVVVDGGRVDGQMRSLTTGVRSAAARAGRQSPPLTTVAATKLAVGWFAVLAIIGFGVLIFAEHNLGGVVAALQRAPVRSFWMGVLGQLAALPVLGLLVLGLVITLLGILLVPFAVVAYIIGAAGVVTLGFLAVAQLTGSAIGRGLHERPTRQTNVRALLGGLLLYLGLWLVAALGTGIPVVAGVLRGVAIAITWVAATAGLGAAIASRAGTRREETKAPLRHIATDELAWQTPTPISGVAAARRPATSKAAP